jgi:CheY-like chemotaxis protein
MSKIQGVEHIGQTLKILIVEDDTATAHMMLTILEAQGHIAQIVGEGEDALKLLSGDQNFDVLFLDYHLPKMNGKTFCHILRNSEVGMKNQDLWIIAHTKEDRTDIIEQMFACGINDYLPKPINPKAFASRILVAQYARMRRKQSG